MNMEFPTAGNLSGSLLVAHPNLFDPNFRRTIIYLSHHSADEGAMGVVLNRPLGKKMHEVAREDVEESIAEVPIYEGGPVGREQVLIATFGWDDLLDGVAYQPLSADEMDAASLHQLRAFVGYAGWGKGQLESEIAQQAWIVIGPSPELISADATPDTWRAYIGSLGPIYRLLAQAPDDPSLN